MTLLILGLAGDNSTDENGEKYDKETVRKRRIRRAFTHLGLSAALLVYIFVGAAIFQVCVIR